MLSRAAAAATSAVNWMLQPVLDPALFGLFCIRKVLATSTCTLPLKLFVGMCAHICSTLFELAVWKKRREASVYNIDASLSGILHNFISNKTALAESARLGDTLNLLSKQEATSSLAQNLAKIYIYTAQHTIHIELEKGDTHMYECNKWMFT